MTRSRNTRPARRRQRQVEEEVSDLQQQVDERLDTVMEAVDGRMDKLILSEVVRQVRQEIKNLLSDEPLISENGEEKVDPERAKEILQVVLNWATGNIDLDEVAAENLQSFFENSKMKIMLAMEAGYRRKLEFYGKLTSFRDEQLTKFMTQARQGKLPRDFVYDLLKYSDRVAEREWEDLKKYAGIGVSKTVVSAPIMADLSSLISQHANDDDYIDVESELSEENRRKVTGILAKFSETLERVREEKVVDSDESED